jgi:hypothetical protein
MRKLSSLTRHVIIVDTDLMSIPFTKKPLWQMNFPPLAKKTSTTALWRQEKRFCQFTPNSQGVIELLKFLDFPNVVQVEPKEKGLEKRYYKGTRATFIGIRDKN